MGFYETGVGYRKKKIGHWLVQRFLKIMIPCYIMEIILQITMVFVYGIDSSFILHRKDIVVLLFNLQGIFSYNENWHGFITPLWFLSYLMIAYLLTPVLEKNKTLIRDNIWKSLFLLIIIQGICAVLCYDNLFISRLTGVWAYSFIYSNYEKYIEKCNNNRYITYTFFMVLGIIIRLLGKMAADNPDNGRWIMCIYDRVIVPNTHVILGFWIFMTIYIWIKKYYNNKFLQNKFMQSIIKWCSQYSLYIYIVHCSFLSGDNALIHMFNNNYYISLPLTISACIFSAMILRFFSVKLIR